jgi:hypothetical protein
MHACGEVCEKLDACCDVKSAFSREFLAAFRDDRYQVGQDLQCNGDDVWCRGHFEVKLAFDYFAEQSHVTVIDMAAIFPQVADNANSAGKLRNDSARNRIWFDPTARLPESGDVVNVDGKFGHWTHWIF